MNGGMGGFGSPSAGMGGGPGPFNDKAFGGGALCSGGGGCGYDVDFCMPGEVIHLSCPGGWQGQGPQDAGYYRSLAGRAFENSATAGGDAADMWQNMGMAYGAEAFDAEKGCGGGHVRKEDLGGGWWSIMIGESSYLYNEDTGACIHYDDSNNDTNDQQNDSSGGGPQAKNDEGNDQDGDEDDGEDGNGGDPDDEPEGNAAACEGPEGNGGSDAAVANPQDVNWDHVTGGVVTDPAGPDDGRGQGVDTSGGWRRPGTECTDPAENMLPAFDGCAVKPLPQELITDPVPWAQSAADGTPTGGSAGIIEVDHAASGASVAAVEGPAQKLMVEAGQARWVDLRTGDRLGSQDIVRTGLGGRATLRFANGTEATVAPGTKMGITSMPNGGEAGQVHLKYGSLAFGGAGAGGLCVTTPAGSMRLMQSVGAVSYQRGSGLHVGGGAGAWRQVSPADAMAPATKAGQAPAGVQQPTPAGLAGGPQLAGSQGGSQGSMVLGNPAGGMGQPALGQVQVVNLHPTH
jgi:hypothetical protein